MKKKGFASVDEYIASFPQAVQEKLDGLRRLVRECAPNATEKMSYQMATFYLNDVVVHFAAHPNHIGFYPTPSGIAKFEHELTEYKDAKGSVQFPLDEPLPMDLIAEIVRFRLEENLSKRKLDHFLLIGRSTPA